jgi:hypothetical protein
VTRGGHRDTPAWLAPGQAVAGRLSRAVPVPGVHGSTRGAAVKGRGQLRARAEWAHAGGADGQGYGALKSDDGWGGAGAGAGAKTLLFTRCK